MSATAMTSKGTGFSAQPVTQTDAAKYRSKYKLLKKQVRQIEQENDKVHLKTLRIKRNIQRMRLERGILYERLEVEVGTNDDLLWERRGQSTTSKSRSAAREQPAPTHQSHDEREASRAAQNGSRKADVTRDYDSESASPEAELAAAAGVAPKGNPSHAPAAGDTSTSKGRDIEYSDEEDEAGPQDEDMLDETEAVTTSTKPASSVKREEDSAAPSDRQSSSEQPTPARAGIKITLKRGNNGSAANGK